MEPEDPITGAIGPSIEFVRVILIHKLRVVVPYVRRLITDSKRTNVKL